MTVVQRATLKHEHQGIHNLTLAKIEPTVYRWLDQDGRPFNGVDYTAQDIAIKALRFTVETEVVWIGWDLTLIPTAPPPEERAAKRIVEQTLSFVGALSFFDQDDIAQAIREETGLPQLIESIELLLAYEIPRMKYPKRPGLDLTHGGLIYAVLEALEKTQQSDLGNLKVILREPVNRIQMYSNVPLKDGKPS